MAVLLQRLSVEDQQKLMMLRAHGLLDDSEMIDFIRMAAAQGGSSKRTRLIPDDRMMLRSRSGLVAGRRTMDAKLSVPAGERRIGSGGQGDGGGRAPEAVASPRLASPAPGPRQRTPRFDRKDRCRAIICG